MPAHEFVTNITFILAVIAVGALLEIAVPVFAADLRQQDRRAANLGLTALTFSSCSDVLSRPAPDAVPEVRDSRRT